MMHYCPICRLSRVIDVREQLTRDHSWRGRWALIRFTELGKYVEEFQGSM
jgi:hypothetical protein